MKIVLFVTITLVWNMSTSSTETPKPTNEEVYYYLYTRDNPDHAIELSTEKKLDSKINLSLPWKIFIHGWKQSYKTFLPAKVAYFEKGDYNIVLLDWSKLANQNPIILFTEANKMTPFLGNFIVYLSKNGVKTDDIHIIGFSIGSHMAGFAGKYLKENGNKSIGRITGLDPAGIYFDNNDIIRKTYVEEHKPKNTEDLKKRLQFLKEPPYLVPDDMRLSKFDAKFVDVIHTDATCYGLSSSIGHADFFPNGGGLPQPGCENSTNDFCSHVKAIDFFIESINSNKFVAWNCKSYEELLRGKFNKTDGVYMGDNVDLNARGNYYLQTNAQPPYGQGVFKNNYKL